MKKWIIFFWVAVVALFIWNLYQLHQKSVSIVHPAVVANRQVNSSVKKKPQVRLISYTTVDKFNKYELTVKLKNTGNVPVINIRFFAQPYYRYQDDPAAFHKDTHTRDPRWIMSFGTQIDRLEPGEEATRIIEFERFSDLTPSFWSDECIPKITFDPAP